MSSAELRRLSALSRRLPIQNIETAHADRDELAWSLNLLADAWPRADAAAKGSQSAANWQPTALPPATVAGIEPGPRIVRHRVVHVVRRTPRRVLHDLRQAA